MKHSTTSFFQTSAALIALCGCGGGNVSGAASGAAGAAAAGPAAGRPASVGPAPAGQADRGSWAGPGGAGVQRGAALERHVAQVMEMRYAFQLAMERTLVAGVEEILGREVLAFMSANHVNPDMAVETFVLKPEA